MPIQPALRQLQLGVRGICGPGHSLDQTVEEREEAEAGGRRPKQGGLMESTDGRRPNRVSEKASQRSRSAALFFFLPLVLCVTSAMNASAQDPSRPARNSPTTPPKIDYERIHFGDVVEIDLVGSLDGDWRGSLSSDGTLSGYSTVSEPIYGLCRETGELAREVSEKLGKLFRNPVVQVRIIDRSGRAEAQVLGAVRSPRRLQIQRPVTLRELLVISGGLSGNLSGVVELYRPGGLSCARTAPEAGGGQFPAAGRFLEIRVQDILRGSVGADPEIGSGDVITVLEAVPAYITGGVARPIQVPTRGDLTLSRAIAMAGGVNKNGNSSKIRIYRIVGGTSRLLEADFDKIEAGVLPDVILQPFDVVEVAEDGKRADSPPPFIRLEERKRLPTEPLPLVVVD